MTQITGILSIDNPVPQDARASQESAHLARSEHTSSPIQNTACLACRKRKIRCDKLFPCTACNQSGIECGFMASSRAKSRSKVLQKLRKAPVEEQMRMNRQSKTSHVEGDGLDVQLLSPKLVSHCTRTYFEKFYPANILVTPAQFRQMTADYTTCPRQYSLVAAVCATTIYSCAEDCFLRSEDGMISPALISRRLIEASLYARSLFDHILEPCELVILTCFFLGCASFQTTSNDKRGWFYLREACTFMQMQGYHTESYYHQRQISDEALYRARLFYFLLSVSERGCALHRDRPVTLDHSINFPLLDTNDPVQRGYQILHDLFAPFDSTFTLFRDTGVFRTDRDPEQYLLDLHRRVTVACPPYSFFASFHRPFPSTIVVDLLITKQWLFLKIYELTLRHSLLTCAAQDADLGLLYPIKIARELIELWERFDRDSIEPHGMSMFAKLFDISAALADLLSVVPISSCSPVPYTRTNFPTKGYGPQDLLQILVKLVSQLSRARQEYLPTLLEKVQRCITVEKNQPAITEPRQQFYDSVNYQFEDLFSTHIGTDLAPSSELDV